MYAVLANLDTSGIVRRVRLLGRKHDASFN
jgi:hypothetical protein